MGIGSLMCLQAYNVILGTFLFLVLSLKKFIRTVIWYSFVQDFQNLRLYADNKKKKKKKIIFILSKNTNTKNYDSDRAKDARTI